MEDWTKVQVESAIPYYGALERASRDGCKIILSCQGADVLFGGLDKHSRRLKRKGEKDFSNLLREDVKQKSMMTFVRENKIAEYLNLELRVPYYDPEVVRTALSISPELKVRVDGNITKYLQKKLAEELGIPRGIAWNDRTVSNEISNLRIILSYIAKENYIKTKDKKSNDVSLDPGKFQSSRDLGTDKMIDTFLEEIALKDGTFKKN
jgi:asparagine synthase (glutamine-hydrolysing)